MGLEKLRIIRHAIPPGHAMLVRTLWNGVHIMTRTRSLTPIDADLGRRVVNAMSLRGAGDEQAEHLSDSEERYVNPEAVRPGACGCLGQTRA